jgi:N-acetylglucosaminyldiphosphoundecaprenol N-acetyl-beta-D-mannosaminyltransferase
MQRSGLEWLYRLAREPKRLWKRYLKNNPLFVLRALGQLTHLKTFPME